MVDAPGAVAPLPPSTSVIHSVSRVSDCSKGYLMGCNIKSAPPTLPYDTLVEQGAAGLSGFCAHYDPVCSIGFNTGLISFRFDHRGNCGRRGHHGHRGVLGFMVIMAVMVKMVIMAIVAAKAMIIMVIIVIITISILNRYSHINKVFSGYPHSFTSSVTPVSHQCHHSSVTSVSPVSHQASRQATVCC